MAFFAGHRLIEETGGLIVLLYLEISPEFAGPFGKISPKRDPDLRRQAEQYLKDNLPGLKVKFAYILLGSLLVASFSFLAANPDNRLNSPDTGLEHSADIPNNSDNWEAGKSIPGGDAVAGRGEAKGTADVDKMGETGKKGAEIMATQRALARLGFGLKPNGVYDARTAETVALLLERYPEYRAAEDFQAAQVQTLLQRLNERAYRLAADPLSVRVLVNKSNALAADYIPPDLTVPKVRFSFPEDDPKKMLRLEAAEALEALFNQAEREQIILLGASGYRAYARQAQIFLRNYQEKGVAANRYSARPGESEHQTGLAMDVTCAAVGNQLTVSFGEIREGEWLSRRAPEFGFIIRFPRGKEAITGYQYEPWHIRYVGVSAAQEIADKGWTLEEYRQNNRT